MPEYQLTPQAIFQNDIVAFDVNFFNPKENQTTKVEVEKIEFDRSNDYLGGYDYCIYKEDGTRYYNTTSSYDGTNGTGDSYTSQVNADYSGITRSFAIEDFEGQTAINGKQLKKETILETKEQYPFVNIEGTQFDGYNYIYRQYKYDYGDVYVILNFHELYRNGWKNETERINGEETTETVTTTMYSPARELQPFVSSWYKTLRNLAVVALLSILVYIGIRITLCSIANDKAKYKRMLVDWTVALCLVFLMHYIMSFSVTINEKIIDMIASFSSSNLGEIDQFVGSKRKEVKTSASSETETPIKKDKDGNVVPRYADSKKIEGDGVQLFRIVKGADKAYDSLVGNKDSGKNKSGDYSRYKNRFSNENGEKVLYWPAYDFMAQARLLGQGTAVDDLNDKEDKDDNKNQEAVIKAGYNIIYVVLVIFTVMFCFTYLKRVIYMAFLTIIAPLVAVTYPIDKINDGSAQAFNMWLKEYIFNLLIQPMHLLLYTILVGSAMKFASKNIIYPVVALGFMVPAEKLLRRFFGFEKSQTAGIFAGPAGTALMMQGMDRLMNRVGNGKIGAGGNGDDDSDEEEGKISTYRNGTDPLDELIDTEGINTSNMDNMLGKQNNMSIPYNPKLAQTQNDGVESSEIAFGDQEYNMYLQNHEKDLNNKDKSSILEDGRQETSKNQNNLNIPLARGKNSFNIPLAKSKRRALKRGLNSYRNAMVKRYTNNKKTKGGWIQRGARVVGGAALGGTMAVGAGMIGIATGDPSKVAQYMGTGLAGGYALGTTGVNKIPETFKEQYKDPLKEARIGYYGEEEYRKREMEKWKKKTFEKNDENLMKIQEVFKVDKERSKEIAREISKYTKYEGIDSFEDALAVKMLQEDREINATEQDAIIYGSLSKMMFGGKKLNNLKRKDRIDAQERMKEKFMSKGFGEEEASKKSEVSFTAMKKFGNYRYDLSNKIGSTNNTDSDKSKNNG